MSYILDALRRADAERQRGAVPGLHDQAGASGAPGASALPAATEAGRAPWPWAIGGVLLAAALGGAWWLGRGAGPAAPPAAPPAPVAVAVPAVVAAPVPPAVPAPAPVPVPVQIQVQVTPAPPPPMAVAAVPAPAAPPAPGPQPLPAAVGAAVPATEATPGRPAAVSPPPPAPAADADPIRAWASLPESTRAALPPLAWSGAVHAERAEQRLVIVNGQVAREGDQLASGLQLLQIRPKSVLLRWQGQRIEMPL